MLTPLNNNQNTKRTRSYQSIIISHATDDTIADTMNGGGTTVVSPTITTSSSCGTGSLAPMKHLTHRDGQHRKLVGVIFIVIAMVLSSLTYAALRPLDDSSSAWRHTGGVVYDDDDSAKKPNTNGLTGRDENELRAEQVITASNALQTLNHHHHEQNRIMPQGCETTLLILRHCEKQGMDAVDKDGNVHCNHLGYERARYIATLFGNKKNTNRNNQTSTTTPTSARWPTPSYLYSLTDVRKQHQNYREWETLKPLADLIGMEIHLIPSDPLLFAQNTYIPRVQAGDLCGKVSVVSWKHSLFPNLANAVGCGPDQGCPISFSEDDYESIWQIKFVFLDPGSSSFAYNHKTSQGRQWFVYGTVVSQGFDPLTFDATSYGGHDDSPP